jgi:hypothetical protein
MGSKIDDVVKKKIGRSEIDDVAKKNPLCFFNPLFRTVSLFPSKKQARARSSMTATTPTLEQLREKTAELEQQMQQLQKQEDEPARQDVFLLDGQTA